MLIAMNASQKLIEHDIRNAPDDALIEQIRQRYPTESEIDRILTRKMRLRSGLGFRQPTLEELALGAQKLIEANLGYRVEISNPKWLSGGASKLQVVFELHWHGHGRTSGDIVTTKLVLRMEPAASITESSRRREFEVLQAVSQTIPVPAPYWIDTEAKYFPYPALIYGFSRGVAKPSKDADKVTGLGQNYGPELRAKVAPHFVRLLASLHNIDVDREALGLAHFDEPVLGSNEHVIKEVNCFRRLWEEDRLEEIPLMEIVYQWLIANAPPIDRISIVHADYRSGNFLFDEETGEITAWLDWEGATLGDRHRDLAYASLDTFSHFAEDNTTLLASGMMPREQLQESYAQASGLTVDPVRLTYYGVFNRYLVAVLTLAPSIRVSIGSKTHQDVLLNYVSSIGYPILEDLRTFFAKVSA